MENGLKAALLSGQTKIPTLLFTDLSFFFIHICMPTDFSGCTKPRLITFELQLKKTHMSLHQKVRQTLSKKRD